MKGEFPNLRKGFQEQCYPFERIRAFGVCVTLPPAGREYLSSR
jgi:hypothetical protein